MSLSATQVHEGAKSLEIKRNPNDEVVKILDQSETDNPESANLTFWLYLRYPNDYGEFGIFFRYQDLDNYYVAYFIQMANQTQFRLGKKETGSLSWTDAHLLGNYINTWVHLKLMLCEIGGTVYAALYKEVSENWVFQTSRTMSPAKWTSGGAIGVGARDRITYGPQVACYLDDTKIYYDSP